MEIAGGDIRDCQRELSSLKGPDAVTAEMTKKATLRELAPEFSFLKARGLRIVSARSDKKPFGDAGLDLQGAGLTLRFQQDRGQVCPRILVDGDVWLELEHVLEFTSPGTFPEYLGLAQNMREMADALNTNWDSIVDSVRSPKAAALIQFTRSRQDEIWKRTYDELRQSYEERLGGSADDL